MKALALLLALALCAQGADIHFHLDHPGFVSLNLYRPDGTVARELCTRAPFGAGDHGISWDGKVDGKPVPSGNYAWRAISSGKLTISALGELGDFGGDRGSPSAAAADDKQIYLGWSLTTSNGDAIVACDPSGKVRWRTERDPLSGCRALAVDAGVVYVLGGEGGAAEGRSIYRLNAVDGSVVPWPDRRTDMKVVSLWPASGKYKPDVADYMAVKNGRIYLSFSTGQFIAVLDAKSGKYLQTIVGAPPGPVDCVGTKSESPDHPNELIDSDFLVTALKGAAVGKLLLAHDPIWVLASDLTPLDGVERITAVTAIGDGAKHHMHDIFLGLSSPLDQVEARSALETETVSYVAGAAGGRPLRGAWQADRMGDIRGMALDATGQLWVAEGNSIPRRISVWSTDSAKGRLVHEYFAPPDPGSPVAVDPVDPTIVYAGGCEWQLDPKGQSAKCVGVVTRDTVKAARFATEKARTLLALTTLSGSDEVFERMGPGDYQKHDGPAPAAAPMKYQLSTGANGVLRLVTADGLALGTLFDHTTDQKWPALGASDDFPIPRWPPPTEVSLTETGEGRLCIAVRSDRIRIIEVKGLETIEPVGKGVIALP